MNYMTEVMTAGYERLTPKDFIAMLKRCDVQRVVDVRELATSRRTGFSKTALQESLLAAKIGYTHLPALGCPREIRHAFRADQNWDRYTKRFRTYLASRRGDVETLADLVLLERCCLLCYEEDFNFCHRTFVAEKLGMFMDAVRIKHLTGPIQGRVADLPVLAAA